MRRASLLLVILIALLLSLGGCGKSRQRIEAEAAAKEAAAKAKAEADAEAKVQGDLAAARSRLLAAFQRRLKDPDSVKYRDVVVKLGAMSDKHEPVRIFVCGHSMTKRSMNATQDKHRCGGQGGDAANSG